VLYTDNPKVKIFIPNSSIAKIIRNKKKRAVLARFFSIILDNKILYVIQVLVRNVVNDGFRKKRSTHPTALCF